MVVLFSKYTRKADPFGVDGARPRALCGTNPGARERGKRTSTNTGRGQNHQGDKLNYQNEPSNDGWGRSGRGVVVRRWLARCAKAKTFRCSIRLNLKVNLIIVSANSVEA